jgi:hypothetical protein
MSEAYCPSAVSSRNIAAEDLRELKSAYDGKRCILTLSVNSQWYYIIPHAWPSQEHLVGIEFLCCMTYPSSLFYADWPHGYTWTHPTLHAGYILFEHNTVFVPTHLRLTDSPDNSVFSFSCHIAPSF